MNQYDVIVIGGGAAGMLAAGSAAQNGAKVCIIEKMPRPGRKLAITGKGRCNITNNLPVDEFLKHVYPNGRFLRNAFAEFYTKDILEILNGNNVKTVLERGGRYFPESQKALDVVDALHQWIQKAGVEIFTNHNTDQLLIQNNRIEGVITGGKSIKVPAVIIATGGKSYPATGSTGDGHELARRAGHQIVPLRPALVPLETNYNPPAALHKLTLKNVMATAWVNGKKAAEAFGEMTFIENGIDGPVILQLSRLVVDELHQNNKIEITVDLKPALDDKKFDNKLLREFDRHGSKKFQNVFSDWLPAALVPVMLELLKIDPHKPCHQVSAKDRKAIRKLLKSWTFEVTGHRPWEEAIITAGGIPTKEISPKTMESKKISGLYFAGEIIDLDADTGGFNLQIAWSTGWLAGRSACNKHATKNENYT